MIGYRPPWPLPCTLFTLSCVFLVGATLKKACGFLFLCSSSGTLRCNTGLCGCLWMIGMVGRYFGVIRLCHYLGWVAWVGVWKVSAAFLSASSWTPVWRPNSPHFHQHSVVFARSQRWRCHLVRSSASPRGSPLRAQLGWQCKSCLRHFANTSRSPLCNNFTLLHYAITSRFSTMLL